MKRRSFIGFLLGSGATAALGISASAAQDCEEDESAEAVPSQHPSTSQGVLDERFGPAIDTHIHVSDAVPNMKPIPPEMREFFFASPEARAMAIKHQMEQGKVKLAFAMPQLKEVNKEKDDPLGIKAPLKVAAQIPGLLRVIGVADPTQSGREQMKNIERQIDENRETLVALKAYLGYVHAYPNDPGYVPYYKLAAKYQLPVIVHTGDTWQTKAKLKFAKPEHIDDVAADYPEVNFVIAHFGNPWVMDAAEIIFKNENVWADLSGLYVGDDKSIDELLKTGALPDRASGFLPSAIKDAFKYATRFDRLLYGSDWPLSPMRSYRRVIEALVPADHHKEVFRTNAEQLFKIK